MFDRAMLRSAAAAVGAAITATSAGQEWGIVEIPTLGGGASAAHDVNEAGRVAGEAETASGAAHAFRWSGGVMTDLGTLGGAASSAHALSELGWVAGESDTPGGDIHAFVWIPGGMIDLGTLGGGDSAALGVNDDGFVTGWSQTSSGSVHVFLWDGVTMNDLVRMPSGIGGLLSRGFDINDAGVIVGEATQVFTKFPTRWTGGVPSFLSNDENALAVAVNDLGDAVGDYPVAGWSIWWRPDGTRLILVMDVANDINNNLQVAGSDGGHAVLWEGGAITDLNDLLPPGSGWVLEEATAVNDLGQIAGVGTLNGQQRGFLLSRLKVELLDPVLPLMSGYDVSSDVSRLATVGARTVVGAAADGVTRLVVRVSGLPGPGTVQLSLTDELGGTDGVGALRSPGGSEDLAAITVPVTTLSDGKAVAAAVYIAPADFVRGGIDAGAGIRQVNLNVQFAGDGAASTSKPILLRRPPVLLLHGLWSNALTWKMPIQTDGRFLVFAQDYESTHAASFIDNVNKPRRGVAAALMKARQLGFAATQADVVGHSMGGILTRMYIADFVGDPAAVYRRQDNFNEGDVNRLITLDTPHTGSPLADILIAIPEQMSDPDMQDIYVGVLSLVGCVDCGAVFDLQTDSPVITNLPEAGAPVHAIVGVGGSDILQAGLEELLLGPVELAILRALRTAGVLPQDIFPPALQHDMIVGRLSQEGGLGTGSTTTSIFGLDDPPGTVAIHTSVTGKDPAVALRIIDLLNTPVTDPTTYAPGFASNAGPGGGAVAGIGLPPYGRVVDGLAITAPLAGAGFAPGDVIDVTVQATDGFVPAHVLAASPLGSAFADAAPFAMQIEVPQEAIGEVSLEAVAFDASWDMAAADPVTVQVNVPAALTGIDVVPETLFLFSFATEAQVHVVGHYDDGVDRRITAPQLGTVYESLDPDIATVDATGRVTAVSIGQTTVLATHGARSASAQVVVVGISCPGDVDLDGRVGVNDFLALLASWGQAGVPADIVDPPGVDRDDFDALLLSWGACEPPPRPSSPPSKAAPASRR